MLNGPFRAVFFMSHNCAALAEKVLARHELVKHLLFKFCLFLFSHGSV